MATQPEPLAETTASVDEIAQILRAEHGDPFHILGMHLVEVQGKAAVAIRAFLPERAQRLGGARSGRGRRRAAAAHPCGRILRSGLPRRAGDVPLSLAHGLCRAARI